MDKIRKKIKEYFRKNGYKQIKVVPYNNPFIRPYGGSHPNVNDVKMWEVRLLNLRIGIVITASHKINKNKYLYLIKISPMFRNLGIGEHVLRKYFSGYYLFADNDDAARLYERIGKRLTTISQENMLDFLAISGMRGAFKLDRKNSLIGLLQRRNQG